MLRNENCATKSHHKFNTNLAYMRTVILKKVNTLPNAKPLKGVHL